MKWILLYAQVVPKFSRVCTLDVILHTRSSHVSEFYDTWLDLLSVSAMRHSRFNTAGLLSGGHSVNPSFKDDEYSFAQREEGRQARLLFQQRKVVVAAESNSALR